MNPLNPLFAWRRRDRSAEKLYGAIVAQARLPFPYQEFGVPDMLAGRFVGLSLHLFAVLHRLKAEGAVALDLAQELIDRFSEDMETVLRELGVSDLKIPKKVRGLAASSASLLQGYEKAFASGDDAVAAAISEAFPIEHGAAKAVSRRLAHYLKGILQHLQTLPLAALRAGDLRFPEVASG